MKAFRILIVIFSFSILNGLIIYIKGSIRFNQASQEQIQLRYVNKPTLIESIGISLLLISVLYLIYRIIIYLNPKYNIWVVCFILVLLNYGIMYSLANLAGDVVSLKAVFNFILIWGINFFIPYSDQFLNRKLLYQE